MFAKILNGNNVYLSPVFALSFNRENSKVVIFDETYSSLIVKKIYRLWRSDVFFLNFDDSDFQIVEETFKCFWNDRDIFRKVKNGKYSQEMLEKAKRKIQDMERSELYPLDNERDFEGFLLNVGYFHDAYVLGMKQEENDLALLIDTTWGSLVKLKCCGVLSHNLEIGDSFFHCTIEKDEDGICFSLDYADGNIEKILKTKEVYFDILFELPLQRFDYVLRENAVLFSYGKDQLEIKFEAFDTSLLDFEEKRTVGYYACDSYMALILILKDKFISFHHYTATGKRARALVDKFQRFKSELNDKGYTLTDHPLIEYSATPDESLGEVLYKERFGKLQYFLWFLKYCLLGLIPYNLLFLIIQLCNPNMKWTMFFIFGPGISAVALFFSIIPIFRTARVGEYLEIREKGIVAHVRGKYLAIEYSCITKIEEKKRIVIHTHDTKLVLPKTKNSKIILNLLSEKSGDIT